MIGYKKTGKSGIICRDFLLNNTSGVSQAYIETDIAINIPIKNLLLIKSVTLSAFPQSGTFGAANRLFTQVGASIKSNVIDNISSVEIASQSDPNFTLQSINKDSVVILDTINKEPAICVSKKEMLIADGSITINLKGIFSNLLNGDRVKVIINIEYEEVK